MFSLKFLLVVAILIAAVQCKKNQDEEGGEGQRKPPGQGEPGEEGGGQGGQRKPGQGGQGEEGGGQDGQSERGEALKDRLKEMKQRFEQMKRSARDKLVEGVKARNKENKEVDCGMVAQEGSGEEKGAIGYK